MCLRNGSLVLFQVNCSGLIKFVLIYVLLLFSVNSAYSSHHCKTVTRTSLVRFHMNCSSWFKFLLSYFHCNFVQMRYVTSYCSKTVFKLSLQSVCVTDEGRKTETF